MKTLFCCICWSLVWVILVGCAPVPEHDSPADPENPDYKPYGAVVRLESVQGGGCQPDDSCVVVAELIPEMWAPKVDAVWVQMCGSERSDDFTSMIYEESQRRWVHRFAASTVGSSRLSEVGEERGLDSQLLAEKSGGISPCWFVVRDEQCKYYLIGPICANQ